MMKKVLAASLAALALTGGAFSVQAEESVFTLEGIVVTASREPEKKIDANADVAVVTAKEVETKRFRTVSDAVKSVPGVYQANYGGSAQIYNSNSIYINGSPNVVVLVDGMRRNTNGLTGSSANVGTLTNMDSVDHIEVLKGSASTLYGSDAQGGVINIITKKPEENKVSTTLRTSFGDNDKENYNLYNEGREGNLFWTVEAGKELMGKYDDGWGRSVINHINAKHYALKLGYDLGDESDVIFRYEKYKTDYTRPDSNSTDTLYADKGKKDNDHISLKYNQKIDDHWKNQFSIYRNKTTFKDNYNLAGASGSMGGYTWGPTRWSMGMKTSGISDQLTWKDEVNTVTGGVDWYQDEITKYHNFSLGYTDKAIPDGKKVHNLAFYLQDKINLTDRWNVTPGIRVDRHSEFGTHTSPSISFGYKQNEKTNYYLNYKEFFVAPDMYQLYASWYGNRNLDPEEGGTWEFGVNHVFDETLSGSFNVFRMHAKNRIIFDSDTWKYKNSGKMDSAGFSLSLNKKLGSHWSIGTGYTYLHIRALSDKENINYNGQLPESVLDVSVNYNSDKLDASLIGRGVMNRYGSKKYLVMRDYGNYWVWDIAANYHFTEEATLFAKVNNIFDQFYTDVGTSRDPDTYWYAAPGRNFEIGMEFKF